jgi:hypothetical protein
MDGGRSGRLCGMCTASTLGSMKMGAMPTRPSGKGTVESRRDVEQGLDCDLNFDGSFLRIAVR